MTCTETFCPLDHVSIDVTDIAPMEEFFREVFGMKPIRRKEENGRITNLWLDGGIQLRLVMNQKPDCGRIEHLAFACKDVDAVLARAAAFGGKPIEGKGRHWFEAFGIYFEMKVR